MINNLFNIQQNIAVFASLNDALSIGTVVKMIDINNKRSKCPASYFIFLYAYAFVYLDDTITLPTRINVKKCLEDLNVLIIM